MRNEILAGNFDVSKQPFLKTILIDKWKTKANVFQKFLSKNMLSSNMWIIAQKK